MVKKLIVKAVIAILLIIGLEAVVNAFTVPMNNSMAMMQLEDSNSAYAMYQLYKDYGKLLVSGIEVLFLILFFYKDIKKIIGGNTD